MALVAFPDAPRLAAHNRTDISVLVLSDSTANSDDEWVYRFAVLLGGKYPSHSVLYNVWNGSSWDSEETLTTGTGLRTITFWNGSGGGYSVADHVTLAGDILEHPPTVDYVVISLGHNLPRGVSDYQSLVDAVVAAWPSASVTMCYQNPRTDDPSAGATARASIDSVVASNNLGLLDAYQPFIDYGDYSSDLLGDAVHPNSAGSALWASTALEAWENSMTVTAQARIVGNGVLLSWTDTNPDSYTIAVTEYDYTDPDDPSTRTVTLTDPDELLYFDEDLDTATDKVQYLITNTNDANTGTVSVLLTGADTFGLIDTAESSARYTTLAKVKEELAIPTAQTGRDTYITTAILVAESWIDTYCGRSFPDTSANPEYAAIPNRVKHAATLLASAFYRDPSIDPYEADIRSEADANRAVSLLHGLRNADAWGIA